MVEGYLDLDALEYAWLLKALELRLRLLCRVKCSKKSCFHLTPWEPFWLDTDSAGVQVDNARRLKLVAEGFGSVSLVCAVFAAVKAAIAAAEAVVMAVKWADPSTPEHSLAWAFTYQQLSFVTDARSDCLDRAITISSVRRDIFSVQRWL